MEENTLKKLVEELQLRRYSKDTIKTYYKIIEKFLKSKSDARRFLLKYADKSKSTMRNVYFALKFFHENVLQENWKEEIPLAKNTKHKLIIAFLYYAGMRMSEVREIKWQDIDFNRKIIHVKRFPKSSLSSQQADEVLRSVTGTGNSRDLKLKKFEASRQKSLIFHSERSNLRGIKPKWKIKSRIVFLVLISLLVMGWIFYKADLLSDTKVTNSVFNNNFLVNSYQVFLSSFSSDPLGLANDSNVLFIDKNNPQCSDSYTRNQALNPETPWCSPKALNENYPNEKLQAGDHIYIREGDYTVYFRRSGMGDDGLFIRTSGTENERLVISSYPRDNVIIRGAENDTANNHMISFEGTNYLTLDSLNFVGYNDTINGRLYMPKMVLVTDAVGIEIFNSSFSSFQGMDDIALDSRGIPGWGVGLDLRNISHSNLRNIEITCVENVGQIKPDGKIDGDGLHCLDCFNATIENSYFYDCGHDLISLKNSVDVIIQNNILSNKLHNGINFNWGENNTVRNNLFKDFNFFPSESSYAAVAIQILDSSYNRIYNNIIYNLSNYGVGIGIGAREDERADANEIFNNLIYSAGNSGIFLANWVVDTNTVANNSIYNNIIFGIKNRYSCNYGPLHIRAYDFSGNNGYGNEFRNNVIRDFNNETVVLMTDLMFGGCITHTYDVNSFDNNFSFSENNLGNDPLFINVSLGDFHLTAGSPAIDSGICISYVNEDFDGTSRPQGSGCDIGPYEYVEAAWPVCGNSICEAGETCESCPSDCGSCYDSDNGDGGGGSGGSSGGNPPRYQCSDGIDNDLDGFIDYPNDSGCSSIRDNSETNFGGVAGFCIEKWVCGKWLECLNSTQQRECYDINGCGTNKGIPQLQRSCEEKIILEEIKEGIKSNMAAVIIILGLGAILIALIAWLLHSFKTPRTLLSHPSFYF